MWTWVIYWHSDCLGGGQGVLYGASGNGCRGVWLAGLGPCRHPVASDTTTTCLVLADTRRGPLYAQIFDAAAQPIGAIFEASIQQLPHLIDTEIAGSDLRVIGTDRMAVADALTMAGISAAVPDIDEMPSASMVARVANEQIIKNQVGPLHPLYLADPRLGPEKNQVDVNAPAYP